MLGSSISLLRLSFNVLLFVALQVLIPSFVAGTWWAGVGSLVTDMGVFAYVAARGSRHSGSPQ